MMPVVLFAALTVVTGPALPAHAATGFDQPQGCVDDTGWWSSMVTPIQATMAPSTLAVGDTAVVSGTEATISIDHDTLLARAGSSLRTAPTLADVGTPDPANPGLLLGQNQLSLATTLRLVATNTTPALQETSGNATIEF